MQLSTVVSIIFAATVAAQGTPIPSGCRGPGGSRDTTCVDNSACTLPQRANLGNPCGAGQVVFWRGSANNCLSSRTCTYQYWCCVRGSDVSGSA
ncbi:hypothetical protein B0T11DRAFT_328606 [Plectosphaerella cucumerina]|uniref:Uncharacterized protein n=1 Tax=Plectosphaerella cucumerina TaxID=40658 RepID=A0A8K0TFN7_9PEZI|nr:hypothetical protein B0T11DRAFT_328606 [Plectosphaerella cucumerina]